MRLLDLIIQEYITIVELLEQENPVENERIIIDREEFKQLLEKYGYLNFTQKTRAYKDLNFIIHDKNNYTLPCKNHTLKRQSDGLLSITGHIKLSSIYITPMWNCDYKLKGFLYGKEKH